MRGLMQERALDVSMLMRRAESLFAHKRVFTTTMTGEQSATWGDLIERSRRLIGALDGLGIAAGSRVGTFGWNTQRHIELYLAVPASGRVLHTLNHRLFARQLTYMVNDAEDEIIFVDRSLLPTVWPLMPTLPTVRLIVVMDDGADVELPADPHVIDYEEMLAAYDAPAPDRPIDEFTAASLCYTSGTTGAPKGVLYSHRSIALHALLALGADTLALSERDVVHVIVPMFHVNAWGLPYAAMLSGSSLVLPGPAMKPLDLIGQMSRHGVTLAAGVPAIWRSLLPLAADHDLSALRMVMSGGSALPVTLSDAWRAVTRVPITSSWGMTETSPLVACSRLATVHDTLTPDEQLEVLCHPGQHVPLTELRVVDDDGSPLPHDGSSPGEVQVAGPTIAAGYFGAEKGESSFTEDGWLRTGDVGTIDPYGYLRIVDRTKDMVKSGGEWISSVELENALMTHPDIMEAAVIGVEDDRWGERPLACVVAAEDRVVTTQELKEFLAGHVASWWIPDEYLFVDQIPKTGTGKFSKVSLREQLPQLRDIAQTT